MITWADTVVLVGAFFLSFLPAYLLMPRLIRSFKARGMTGKDMNKPDRPEIAEMGGVAVVLSFFVGVSGALVLIAIVDSTLVSDAKILLAALVACLGAAFVGVIDDLFDLRQSRKALYPVFFAIPLGIYLADTAVHLPRGVNIELGIWMVPVVAFMVSAGANAANMLEGFNGLGAGMGLIMSGALITLSILTPHPEALVLLVPLFGSSAAFLVFNRYPAKVFPGDTFTLFYGATLVCSAVVMGFKEVGALLFIPMIAEFILKSRNRFDDESFGSPDVKGRLHYRGPIGSLTHVLMKGRGRSERSVVHALWGMEALIAVLVVAFIVI